MATFKFSSPLDLPDAPAPGVPEPAQAPPPMPGTFTGSGPAGFERENLPPEAWPDLNTGEGPGTELVRGTANFMGGAVEGALTGAARMGDDLSGQMSGLNNAINAGLNQITGADLPMRTGNERELMTMRAGLPQLSDKGSAASSAGQFVGEAVAPAMAGGLALQGFRVASAASRLPRHWKDAAELISTLGMGSPTRARVAQQLAAKRASPGGAPMSPARGQMLSNAQPGIAQRGLAAAGGGAIAGAAGSPADPGMGAALGAMVGPMAAGGAGMLKAGGSAVADKVAQFMARRSSGNAGADPAIGLSDEVMARMMTSAADNPAAIGARVAAARAGDIAPTAPIYQQADSTGVSGLHKFLSQRNAPYNRDTYDLSQMASRQLSQSLASKSAGLSDDLAARSAALDPQHKALQASTDTVSTAPVRDLYDDLLRKYTGRDAVVDRLRSGRAGLDDDITANEMFNRRASINDMERAKYDPTGKGSVGPLDAAIARPLTQIRKAMREAIHDGTGQGARAAQMIDKLMEDSTDINAKEVFAGILKKSLSSAANKADSDGTQHLLSSSLVKQIQRVKDNPKNWGKLDPGQQQYLARLSNELRRNQGAELKGASVKSDTAQNILNDIMPKSLADLPLPAGSKLAKIAKELATGAPDLEQKVVQMLAGRMTDPKQFGDAIARINYAAQQKQISAAAKTTLLDEVRQAILRVTKAGAIGALNKAPMGMAANASRTLGPVFSAGPQPGAMQR